MSGALSPKPVSLFPGVWPAQSLGGASVAVWSSGYAALDAELPGGGWPVAGLVELLLPAAAPHRWQVLLPGLAARLAQHPGPLVLVGRPAMQGVLGSVVEPFGLALAAQGLAQERVLRVDTDSASARLWTCEQALRCADVVAVVGWLAQRARSDHSAALRRLHVGAMAHGTPVFVVRPAAAQQEASAAPLRLLLQEVSGQQTNGLQVRILKRRGPPLAAPLALRAYPERLAAVLAARRPRLEVAHALARAVSA